MPATEHGPALDLDPYPQARDRITESFARWAAARNKPVERWIADLFRDRCPFAPSGHRG